MIDEPNIIPPDQSTEIPTDQFISSISGDTEKDQDPTPEPAPPPTGKPTDGSKLTKEEEAELKELEALAEPELLADLAVETFDLAANIGCQVISGENDHTLFSVPADQKNRIKRCSALVIKKMDIQVNPVWLLIILILVVYGSKFMTAINLRSVKRKANNPKTTGEIRRGPGRPSKEEVAIREAKENAKK